MTRSLKVAADTLADELGWMAKLRAGSGFNPVTGCVQITAVVGALQLRRTDFEQFRETVIPVEGAGQSAVTVDTAKLAALLKGASGPATVDVGDTGLSVGLAGRTVRLRATGNDEFPPWPGFEPTATPAVLGAPQLARALASVGLDEALPALTGVAFDGGAMVTTDRFRLTRIVYAKSGFTALVPGTAVRAFASGTDVVTVEPGKRRDTGEPLVRLSSGGRSVVAPMLDCEFPKWRPLIPDEDALSLSVLLRRDDLLAAAQGEQVTLTVDDDDTMLVCATSSDGDVEVTEQIAVSVIRADGPFTVKVSTRLLTGCLRAVGCGAVRLQASAPDKPVMLTDAGESDTHLIMPTR